MRNLWLIGLVVMARVTTIATSGSIYPTAGAMNFSWSVNADTVTVSIKVSVAPAATGLYVSETTVAAPKLLQCVVDGTSIAPPPTEIDTIYPSAHTTRWLIGTVAKEVRLKYYVADYHNSHLHWTAMHDTPVMGIANDPVCCVNRRGNVDNDPADLVDLSDLVALIAIVVSDPMRVQCLNEANIDADANGLIDLSDLSLLVNHLTSPATPLLLCSSP